MNNTQLTDKELLEWRAGELRRNEYWDKRISAYIEKPEDYLSPEQINAIKGYWEKWNEPVNPSWTAWYYKANGLFSPCYVPSNIYYGRITRALNRRDYLIHPLLQDKNYLDLVFPELLRPEVIVRNINGQFLNRNYRIISEQSVLEYCYEYDEIVIKPTIETMGAKNVLIISPKEYSREAFLQLLSEYKKDYVIQKALKQHPALSKLNKDSINTIRVMSLLWQGKVIIVGALVRIGTKGIKVDNLVRSNGISCAIDKTGHFIEFGYDKTGKPYREYNGNTLNHYEIPEYKSVVKLVKEYHPRIAHFKLVGWDFSINSENEPVLIEVNMDQPDLYFHQLPMGPLFGENGLLEEILEYTYSQYPMYW